MAKRLIKNIFSDTILYGITNYLGVIVGIILLPVYTRIFSKADYGVLDIFNVWNNFFIMLLPLGIYSGILRFYPEYKDNINMIKQMKGTILLFFVFISFVYVVVMLLFKTFILQKAMHLPLEDKGIYTLSLFVVIGSLFLELFKSFFRIEFKKLLFLFSSLINFFLLTFLGFILVYFFGFGINGFFIASVSSLFVANLFAFYFFKDKISYVFDKSLLFNILRYSIHFVSVSILFKMTDIIDRYLLSHYLSLSVVGEYAIAVKISNFYNILLSAITFAWMPYVLSKKDENELKQIIKTFASIYVSGSVMFLVLLISFQDMLLRFFAPNFIDSGRLIPIIASYMFVNGAVYFFSLGIQIKKITKVFTFAAILSVLVNFFSSIALIKVYAEVGVALGSLFGSIVWVIILIYFSQKHFRIHHYKTIVAWYLIYIFSVYLLYTCNCLLYEKIIIDSVILLLGIVYLRYVIKNLRLKNE